MAAPNRAKEKEKPKTCPECSRKLHTTDVRVRAKGWKPYYHCKCGTITPTAELRR